ncbi:uncharacterized protein I206_101676 [Kwoniella pini CBS 10737]|uniref:HSF-type DNA-binding domain-containing protein n=1 Tax=Kwoniella pini CBS 10737 TaxID=1296096 RepID=A0A1B9HW10_9TREE|nr:uncharacterized protein I206_06355 [Kwoniella pini CBS 10737]OCF47454.1 hypothetical protein I206_06355 [Kwoniella pini CBS 10737]
MPQSLIYEPLPEGTVGRYTAINGGSKPPNFLQKLFDFLSLDPHPYPDIMYWGSDSKQLVIAQPDKLAEEVLPKLFKHDKIASFGRQLNIYGFSRLFPGRQFKDVNGNISDASVWAHPTLDRLSTPSDLLSIKRRAPPKLIRTRKLPNGEIIKTKASQHVIEKAKRLKQDMLISKSHSHSRGKSIWNNNKHSKEHPVDEIDNDTQNTWKDQLQSSLSSFDTMKQMKRNDTLLSDITEYSENGTGQSPLFKMNNSANTNTTMWSNSASHLTPTLTTSSRDTKLTGLMPPLNLHLQKSPPLMSSYTQPFPNPSLLINERLYSSCPASIHTSPTIHHNYIPPQLSWNNNASSGNNLLTSSIDTHNHPFEIGNNPGSFDSSYQSDVPYSMANDQPAWFEIDNGITQQNQPSRIAAPAAAIPTHLLQNRNQASRQFYEKQIDLNQSQGIIQPSTPISNNSIFDQYKNNSIGLSSSWNKQINLPSSSLYTGSSFLIKPKPILIGNGNGTIDPKWISPINSEWSTPSISRLTSPNHLIQTQIQTPSYLGSTTNSPGPHLDKIPKSENTFTTIDPAPAPSFVWYNPTHMDPSHSSDSLIEPPEPNNGHTNHINQSSIGTSANISHSFENTTHRISHQSLSLPTMCTIDSNFIGNNGSGNTHEYRVSQIPKLDDNGVFKSTQANQEGKTDIDPLIYSTIGTNYKWFE